MHYPRLTIACLIAACFVLPATAAEVIETKTHRLEQVADGVYFIVGTGSIFVMSNAMAIVTDEDVVVVDSHITPAASRALIESIKTVTDKPITTLINSHFHYDHAHGNQSFGPDVQIIGHEYTRQKLNGEPLKDENFLRIVNAFDRGLADLQERLANTDDAKQRSDIEARIAFNQAHIKSTEEITPVAPDITMNNRLTLFRGGREIQIRFLGRAHTGGDIVIYLPKEKIIFTGDMFYNAISWLGDGYVSEWSATLEKLKQLDFDLVLPGHGPAFSDFGRIDHLQHYYDDLYKEIVKLRAMGLTVEQAAKQADLTQYADTLGVKKQGVDLYAVQRIYQLLE